ncbi:MAG: hypothetical protein EHM58_07545 [Ignavibacteriae bacterium]|nr:MAG: hypothetical protein EHM58_07545 [Ignavibacteriota bacterium]
MKSCILLVTLLVFSFLIYDSPVNSQVVYGTKAKSPTFIIEISGSYDLPIMDAGGNVSDFFAFKTYGTSVGWGSQFNFKFGIGDKAQYRPYLSLGYSQLQSSDEKLAYIDSNTITTIYPLKGSSLYDSTAGKSSLIFRMPYIGVGFEYAFVETNKKRTFIPFIGVGFTVSIITGMYRQTPIVSKVPSSSGLEIPFTIKPDVRVGMTAGLGADVRLTKSFGLNFGTKFQIANLIGKKSDIMHEVNKLNLLDAADTQLNTNLNANRSIGFMEFYLGVSFLMGKSKK